MKAISRKGPSGKHFVGRNMLTGMRSSVLVTAANGREGQEPARVLNVARTKPEAKRKEPKPRDKSKDPDPDYQADRAPVVRW